MATPKKGNGSDRRKKIRMRAVTGVIPPSLRTALERIAENERRTVSQLVRLALEDFVARKREAA